MAKRKLDEDMVRCHIKIKNVFFPKDYIESGGYAAFSADIVKVVQGEPVVSKYGDVRFCGSAPSLNVNVTYAVCATYSHHEKYGDQYKLVYMNEVRDITDPSEQRAFLSTVLTDNQLNKLYENFENPFDLIKTGDVKSLCSVKGIGEDTAKNILSKYNDRVDHGYAYAKLTELGLTVNAIDKLVQVYGSADTLVEKIQKNPYILIEDAYGIGWNKADSLAMNMGISRNSQFRVEAYIMHFLSEYAESGNSMVQAGKVINNCMSDLGLNDGDREVMRDALFHLHDVRKTLWWNKDRSEFALERVRKLEQNISQELKRLIGAPVDLPENDMDESIRKAEEQIGIEYTNEQKDAIKKICSSNVCILTGFGGTGKTTVVAGALKVLSGKTFSQIALSGRAAARMQEVTGQDGLTIHRLLGYDPFKKAFSHNRDNKIEDDIIILDETSMVGAQLFYDLIQAVEIGHRLIMIGDDGQLESIGLCNIFKDMLDSGSIPVIRLTKIHRQAAKSAIITESIKVRNANQLVPYGWTGNEIRGELQDLELDVYKDAKSSFDNIVNQYHTLYNKEGMDSAKIQIVLPQKMRGSISTFNVNNAIQEIVNPYKNQSNVKVTLCKDGQEKSYILREGDQVILNRNNYNLKHINESTGEKTVCPVYNGNRGVIRKIDGRKMLVDFDQWGTIEIPNYENGENVWNTLELAYALTCHKLQGSEAPYVIVGLDFSARIMLTREWLYTAITRAKKRCIICAETKALDFAVKTSNVPYKKTFLKWYLQEEIYREC